MLIQFRFELAKLLSNQEHTVLVWRHNLPPESEKFKTISGISIGITQPAGDSSLQLGLRGIAAA